jgi:GAF domain-containing protein
LYLGPFQGKVACTRIPFNKGVCGTSAHERKELIVADVHAFPGHIACDNESESELVVPIVRGDIVLGVFDMDCLTKNGFTEADAACIKEIIENLVDLLPGISWVN